MSDVLTPEQRRRCMSPVKGKDTKPEMVIRKYLFSKGLRYRLHNKRLVGHPDIVLKKYKTAIFIDGCFWHGHEGCKYFKMPESNEFFWEQKIGRNKARDIANEYVLKTLGWRVIRIWECEIRKVADREERLNALYHQIVGFNQTYSIGDKPNELVAEPEEEYTN